jgi:hypothetical protein
MTDPLYPVVKPTAHVGALYLARTPLLLGGELLKMLGSRVNDVLMSTSCAHFPFFKLAGVVYNENRCSNT